MNTLQLNGKTRSSISKGKSTRRFGQDLTNCYNVQTRQKQSLKSTLCFQFMNHADVQPKTIYSNIQYGDKYQFNNMYEINLMLSEATKDPINDHVNDIMSYTLGQSFVTWIEEDYMRWHSEITQQIREILIGWIIKIQSQLKLQHSTLCLAVYLIDKYCYQQSVPKSKYQLLGITALFMAAKYEELATPRMNRFLQSCDGLFSRKNLVMMEGQILESVNFNINKIVLLRELLFNRVDQIFRTHKNTHHLGYMQDQNEGYSIQQKRVLTRCEYLIELTLMEYRFSLMQPHYLSSVLLYVCCKKQNISTVNSKYIIQKYGLSQKIFKQYFQSLLELTKRKGQKKFWQINKKYYHLNNEY